ncbi:MAG: DNA polymerase III subunit delta [Planctomycetota bacterium]
MAKKKQTTQKAATGSLFLVYGESDYEREAQVESLISKAFGGADPELALIRIDCATATSGGTLLTGDALSARILDELNTPPFLGAFDKKLVHLKNAGNLMGSGGDAFARYVDNPAPFSTLIVESPTIDKRRKVFKALLDSATVFEFKKLYATAFGETRVSATSPLGRWVQSRATERKITLSPDAVVLLIELVGDEQRALDSTIEKLAVSSLGKSGGVIDMETVAEQVSGGSGDFLFKMTDAMLAGDSGRAMPLMADMFARGITDQRGKRMLNAEGLISMALAIIAGKLGNVESGRAVLDNGERMEAALKAAGAGYGPQQRTMDPLIRLWKPAALNEAHDLLFETEYAIKSGDEDARGAFERMAVRMSALATVSKRM